MKIKGIFPLNFQSSLLKNIFQSVRRVLTNKTKDQELYIIYCNHSINIL